MKRRALGIGLGLLTVALWVGPIVAAFASNGWNLKKTVMPSGEKMSEVRDTMSGFQEGFKESVMSFGNFENEDGETSLTLYYKSAFPEDIKIKKFEFALSGTDVLQMESNEVEIGPQENVPIVLSGQVGKVTKADLEGAEISGEFEIFGATIAFAQGAQGG